MPDQTDNINFKKTLQTEQDQKERRQKIFTGIAVLIIISALFFLYQRYNQPKIQTEVLPNTSLSYLSKPNLTQANNTNGDFSKSTNSNYKLNGNCGVYASKCLEDSAPEQIAELKTTNFQYLDLIKKYSLSKPEINIANLTNKTRSNDNTYTDNKSLYFTGKIDGKIPLRMVLSEVSPATGGQLWYQGEEIYDGVSEKPLFVKASLETGEFRCQDKICPIEIKEFESQDGADNYPPKDLSISTFEGKYDKKNGKITGTWTKANNNQKLKFELNRSEEFEIEKYLIEFNQNKSLYLNADCLLGHIQDAQCRLYNSKNNTRTVELISCKLNDAYCFSSVYFGKKIDNIQYILIEHTLAPQHFIEIYKFNILQPNLEQVGDYVWDDSQVEKNDPQYIENNRNYQNFIQAQKNMLYQNHKTILD